MTQQTNSTLFPTMNHSILCVDDEVDIVDALERLFRRTYKVFKATSADQGLAILKENPVSLIISDQRMPQKTGVEFLKATKKICPDAIRILLTGFTDIESAIEAINKGEVYRYLTKPWDPADLVNTVHKAIERYELAEELKKKNQELADALTELQTLDKAKTEFMILVNHELKTPLTVILSFLELLKESSLSQEQTGFVNRIDESSQRLMRLIQDSLELVSSETGQIKIRKSSFLVADLLSLILEQYEERIEKSRLKVKVKGLSNIKVLTDKDIVGRVLKRLIDNAIKFSFDKGEIEIDAEKLPDGRVLVAIQNEGKAISSSMIKRVLEPFTLNEQALHHSEGNGLGLSICRSLLKNIGSELQIQSTRSNVTVQFDLPMSGS